MDDITKKFETMTDVGKNHTKSCRSDAKVMPVMALKSQDYVNMPENSGHMSGNMMPSQIQGNVSANYNPSYFSANYMPPLGAPAQVPMMQQPYTFFDQSQFISGGATAAASQVPPMPDYLANQLTEDAWRAACSATQQ